MKPNTKQDSRNTYILVPLAYQRNHETDSKLRVPVDVGQLYFEHLPPGQIYINFLSSIFGTYGYGTLLCVTSLLLYFAHGYNFQVDHKGHPEVTKSLWTHWYLSYKNVMYFMKYNRWLYLLSGYVAARIYDHIDTMKVLFILKPIALNWAVDACLYVINKY